MKMKRFLAWLLALVMCFTMVACQKKTTKKKSTKTKNKEQTSQSTDSSDQTGSTDTTGDNDGTQSTQNTKPGNTDAPQSYPKGPILYRVTDKKGNVTWLFGSIHVGREDYYPLPDYVMNAFNGADSLAVELDIIAFEKDTSAQVQALSQLVYRDGTTIKDHIPQALYDKAVGILKENNSYMGALDYYCPVFWSSMVESLMAEDLGADANLGIDRYLINQAYETDKEILEVESAELQYRMLANFSDKVQYMILASSVASYEDPEVAAAELKAMMDLWVSGDEEAFGEYVTAVDPTMTQEEKQAYECYNDVMVTGRNIAMADYAESALASGKEVFICVGAAHVIGDGGMADLLTQRGYTVERVTK